LSLVLGEEEVGLGCPVLLDLHAAELLVKKGVPFSCIVDKAAVEKVLPLLNAALIGAGLYLRKAGSALEIFLLLQRSFLRWLVDLGLLNGGIGGNLFARTDFNAGLLKQ
jgi:hypothetical protein